MGYWVLTLVVEALLVDLVMVVAALATGETILTYDLAKIMVRAVGGGGGG